MFTLFQSEAQEHEMAKMLSFGGGIGSMSREARLREAAKIYIRLGNLQRYCELLVELGEVGHRQKLFSDLIVQEQVMFI